MNTKHSISIAVLVLAATIACVASANPYNGYKPNYNSGNLKDDKWYPWETRNVEANLFPPVMKFAGDCLAYLQPTPNGGRSKASGECASLLRRNPAFVEMCHKRSDAAISSINRFFNGNSQCSAFTVKHNRCQRGEGGTTKNWRGDNICHDADRYHPCRSGLDGAEGTCPKAFRCERGNSYYAFINFKIDQRYHDYMSSQYPSYTWTNPLPKKFYDNIAPSVKSCLNFGRRLSGLVNYALSECKGNTYDHKDDCGDGLYEQSLSMLGKDYVTIDDDDDDEPTQAQNFGPTGTGPTR